MTGRQRLHTPLLLKTIALCVALVACSDRVPSPQAASPAADPTPVATPSIAERFNQVVDADEDHRMALEHLDAEQYAEGEDYLRRLIQREGDLGLWATERLGFCLAKIGSRAQALAQLEAAEKRAIAGGAWLLAAGAARAQASLQRGIEQEVKTNESLLRARKHLETAGGVGTVRGRAWRVEALRIDIEQAKLDMARGMFGRAEAGFRNAASELDSLGQFDVAGEAWRGLGETLADQGALAEAQEAYLYAGASYTKAGYRRGAAALHTNLAALAQDRRRYLLALGEYEAALREQTRQHNSSASLTLVGEAEALVEMGSYDAANAMLDRSTSVWKSYQEEPAYIPAYVRLWRGEILRREGHTQEAITTWGDLSGSPLLDEAARWYLLLCQGRALAEMGDSSAALDVYVQGVNIVEKLASGLSSQALRSSLVARPWPLYDGIIEIYHKRGDFLNALTWMERSRAQSHRQALLASVVRRDVVNADMFDVPRQSPPLDLALFSQQPGAPSLTAVYHVLDDGVLVYRIRGTSLQGNFVRIRREALESAVRDYARLLQQQSRQEEVTAVGLAQLLLAPLEEDLTQLGPDDRVAFVPHGVLHLLPFHALPSGTSRLVDRVIPLYLPLVGDLALLRRHQGGGSGPHPLIAVSNDPNIPEAADEARCITGIRSGDRLDEIEDMEKFRAAASKARSIHLIGHGEGAGDHQPGRIILGNFAKPFILDATRAQTLDLVAEEVVLSTCLGRSGEVSIGDDMVGVLSRAFLQGGARGVVAAEGWVDGLVSRRLMISYHRYREHRGPAEALALAQRDMLHRAQPTLKPARSMLLPVGQFGAEVRDLRYPGFWAAFSFTGDPGPPATYQLSIANDDHEIGTNCQ